LNTQAEQSFIYSFLRGLAFCFRQAFHFDADAFCEDKDAVGHSEAFGFGDEAFDRFVVGFIAQGECAVVHGDEYAGLHLDERAHGLLGVHVDVSAAGGVVGADGHQCDIGGVVFADFLEAFEVGAVAAVEDFAGTGGNHVAAVVAVGVVEVSCAPVVTWGVGDLEVVELESIPDRHFVDGFEAESFNELAAAVGHDDTFVGFEDFEAFFMEVVEVGVGDHDEVDQWHQGEVEAGFALAFNHTVPVRPVRVDDDGVVGKLDEKRGVADPGDADFSGSRRVRDGFAAGPVAFLEDLGEQSVAQEVIIAPWPSFFGQDTSVVFTGLVGAFVGALGGHDRVVWSTLNTMRFQYGRCNISLIAVDCR
jgi:hypothetical protein